MNSIRRDHRFNWRRDAEGLRGVAILAVLIFHAVPSWLPGGFVGVDIFFVLSGFLVGNLIIADLADDRFSYSRFYERRARRLFPALLVVLLATLVAAPFIVGGDDYKALGQQAAASAMFAANLLAWAQAGYFDVEAAYKPLIHLWSLGVEEQFYALFPIALVSLWRHSRKNVGRVMVWATVISLACCIGVTVMDGNAAFYLPFTRFWEFLGGAWLAWNNQEHTRRMMPHDPVASHGRRAGVASAVGALLLSGSFFLLPEAPNFPGWQATIPVAGAIALLAAGQDTWINRVVLSSGILCWMGKISYAAYLWHWPILVFARHYTGNTLSPLSGIYATLLAVLLAAISTRFIETPFRTGKWSHTRESAKVLWFFMAIVGVLAIPATSVIDGTTPPKLTMLEHYPSPDYDLWREGKNCFVNLEREFPFGAECLGGVPNGRPLVVLWGDSHAAHLWPGLAKEAAIYYWKLAQLTVSQCPPLINSAGEHNTRCPAMRIQAIDTIRSLKPDTIVLASRWTMYDKNAVLKSVVPTVRFLKSIGIRHILIIGPVPRWVPTLPKALASDMRKQKLSEPPLRTTTGLEEGVFTMDQALQAATKTAGAGYVSTLSILCGEDRNCRAWVDEGQKTTLMAYDGAHLTPQGSEWLARRMSAEIFALPR